MSSIRERMTVLLGETEEAGEDVSEVGFKAVIPQLILAMQAVNLDPSDEEAVDSFLKMMKTIATTKSSMFKTYLKRWAPSKATRAVKAAKMSI